jgi:hypothetical protein
MRAATPSDAAMNERRQNMPAARRQPAQSSAAPAFVDRRAQAIVLRKAQEGMNGSPRTLQLMALQAMVSNGRQPLQLRAALNMASATLGAGQAVAQLTAVTEDKKNSTDKLTSDKKIETKNQGEAWFRYAQASDWVIESFGDNKTTESPKGKAPVSKSIDLADSDISEEEIGELTRAKHFGAGDRLAGIEASDRKGKWTWHHKQDPYEMELVDMAVHKSFYHHGGFSKWKEDSEEED